MSDAEAATTYEPLVDANVVGDFLRRRPDWVYRQAVRGLIPSYKVGPRRLFRLSEVEEWLQTQRTPANGSTSS